jgi:hypothetical protein
MSASSDSEDVELTAAELRYWIEFGCWATLVLAPFLYWVNGPAVSTDQFVVRTALVVLAACGGVGLRCYAWLHRQPSCANELTNEDRR